MTKKGRKHMPDEPVTPVPEKVPPTDDPVVAEPVDEPAPVVADSKEAGLQKIQEAIRLLSTHSAANIGGSTIGDALILLSDGYSILVA